METTLKSPFYPIIYVRGYAGTESEVEDTVADPYMGFNLGSTKIRQAWTGQVGRHFFEAPVVRLMKEYGYTDLFSDGEFMPSGIDVGAKSIVVYRYYDRVSKELGDGVRLPIETFGLGLRDLILQLRDRVCGNDPGARQQFKVYLVGHSMGGLVIRCFLQNDKLDPDRDRRLKEARSLVDKAFTYATPHNGIDFELVGNVPAILTANNANNFNRPRMAEYLGLEEGTDPVHSLNGKYDPDRFFCLVGTNARDYAVAYGWSTQAVGPYSDGLVRINNAFVTGPVGDGTGRLKLAPRAYVHRSHSGHYGIVNSEEGYQNLVRFLFGNVRVDGHVELSAISLPPEIDRKKAKGSKVRASYHFEAIVRVRGAKWDLSRRVQSENSTVFRLYDELFPEKGNAADPSVLIRTDHDKPQLFTVFLDRNARIASRRPSLGFSIDVGVLVPEYEVDGFLWLKDHYEGGYLFREKINLEAVPPSSGDGEWRLRYGYDTRTPNRATMEAERTATADLESLQFRIPIEQSTKPGLKGDLVLTARSWN